MGNKIDTIVNWLRDPPGNLPFHYLKDRYEGPLIEKEFGSIFSDRYKLLKLETGKKKRQTSNRGK
jgi:hypothetical protein